jgi:hypothetical protein
MYGSLKMAIAQAKRRAARSQETRVVVYDDDTGDYAVITRQSYGLPGGYDERDFRAMVQPDGEVSYR